MTTTSVSGTPVDTTTDTTADKPEQPTPSQPTPVAATETTPAPEPDLQSELEPQADQPSGLESSSEPEPAEDGTAAQGLSEWAASTPGLAALVLPIGKRGARAERYRTVTYAELDRRSSDLAVGLVEYGIGPGVRTAMLVPPGEDFFVLTFALLKARAVPVLVDPGLGKSNLKACLNEAAPTAFIGIGRAQFAHRFLGWAKSAERKVTVGGMKWPWGGASLKQLEARGRALRSAESNPATSLPTGSVSDLAVVAFTSGSTGSPKGVEFRTSQLLAQADILRELYDIKPGEVTLATFPPFALLGPALGVTTVMPVLDPTRPAAVDPRRLCDAVNRYSVSLMFGSPALLETVSRWGTQSKVKMPTLRRIISAGAPVTRAVQRRTLPLLAPDAQIYSPYGATEALPVTSIGSTEVLALRTEGICVGRPVPGVDVTVVPITEGPIADLTDVGELPQGEIGEFVVRGANVTTAYIARPEANAKAKLSWDGEVAHRMGDAGYVDPEGRLWFCGRVSHRVQTAVSTMYSVPCEEVFNGHVDVYRSALVGVGAPGEQTPVICIQLERPTDEGEELRSELLSLAAANPQTAQIQTLLFTKNFPVDIRHNSKIRREELAAWAATQLK